jgi:hypothetical protein
MKIYNENFSGNISLRELKEAVYLPKLTPLLWGGSFNISDKMYMA